MAGGRKSSGARGGRVGAERPTKTQASDGEAEGLADSGPSKGSRHSDPGLELAPDTDVGRVALALRLMDSGDIAGARGQLSQVLAPAPDSKQVRRSEAPLSPEREPDPKHFGDDPRQSNSDDDLWALEPERASTDTYSPMDPAAPSDDFPEHTGVDHASKAAFVLARSPAFATQTMAGLLDRQGDHIRADGIRERLDEREQARESKASPRPHVARALETLDSWLRNLQRERP